MWWGGVFAWIHVHGTFEHLSDLSLHIVLGCHFSHRWTCMIACSQMIGRPWSGLLVLWEYNLAFNFIQPHLLVWVYYALHKRRTFADAWWSWSILTFRRTTPKEVFNSLFLNRPMRLSLLPLSRGMHEKVGSNSLVGCHCTYGTNASLETSFFSIL